MRTDVAAIKDPAILDAKASWLERFTGAVLEKEIQFGSPVVQNLFKRTYYITARNFHFVSVFGRVLLGEEQTKLAEDMLAERMEKVKGQLQALIQQNQIEIDDAKLGKFYWNAPAQATVKLTSRFSTRHLDLLILVDQYMSGVHTLWIADQLEDPVRARQEREVKKQMRAIASSAREMFLSMRKRMNAQKLAAAEAGESLGTGDDAEPDEAGPATGGAGPVDLGGTSTAAQKPRVRRPAATKETDAGVVQAEVPAEAQVEAVG